MKASALIFESNGKPLALGVAEATFHLRQWDAEARAGVKRAGQLLFPLIEPHATFQTSGSSRRPAKMSRTVVPRFLASLDEPGRTVRLELESGPTYDSCGPWTFDCQVDPDDLHFSEAAVLRVSSPAEPLERSPAEFRAHFCEVAAMLRAEAGQGGFGVGINRGYPRGPRDETIAGWIKRYRGLDLEDSGYTRLWSATQIKGPGWLTFLGPAFCEKLGGRAAIAGQLSKSVEIVDLPTGVVLVAGPQPRMGDVNAAEDMAPYVEVARVLKPIRMDKPHPLPGLNREQMAAWLARFDEP